METFRAGPDELVAGGLLVLQPAEGAPPLLGQSLAGRHPLARGGLAVQDEVVRLLHGAEESLAAPLEVVGAGPGLEGAQGRGLLVVTGDEALAGRGVEGETPAGEILEESALLLTGDIIRHPARYQSYQSDHISISVPVFLPRDYRVQVAGVGVICPLVGTVELLRGDAAVLQVLRVPAGLVAPGLGPPGLPAEAAGESEDVVVGRQTGETRLRQTELLTVSPVGDLLHYLVIETFQFPVENPLEGPGLVPALVHDAPEADLLEVVRSVSLGQVVTPALGVAVQRETSLAVVVDREGGAVRAFE